MDIYIAIFDKAVLIPQGIYDLIPLEDTSLVSSEEFQEVKFSYTQKYLLILPEYPVSREINSDFSNPYYRPSLFLDFHLVQDVLYPTNQLPGRKGLYHIVIGPQLETLYPGFFLSQCGKDNYRQPIGLGMSLQELTYFPATQLREHNIQD